LLLLRDEKSSLARECARLQGAVAILEGELGQLRDLKGALEQDLQLSRDEKSSLEQECAARKGAVAILEDDLSQLRDWKGALERKLAALDKLNHISQEVLDAARTERQDALDGARAERERHEAEIARLGALIAMAKTLARRAGKFPFVLYFGRKRKYRPILVALQSATVAADPGVAPVSPEA
jgi:chromosome segregation ATPase